MPLRAARPHRSVPAGPVGRLRLDNGPGVAGARPPIPVADHPAHHFAALALREAMSDLEVREATPACCCSPTRGTPGPTTTARSSSRTSPPRYTGCSVGTRFPLLPAHARDRGSLVRGVPPRRPSAQLPPVDRRRLREPAPGGRTRGFWHRGRLGAGELGSHPGTAVLRPLLQPRLGPGPSGPAPAQVRRVPQPLLCGGVTAGYLAGRYVQEHLPLRDGNDYVTATAVPGWMPSRSC